MNFKRSIINQQLFVMVLLILTVVISLSGCGSGSGSNAEGNIIDFLQGTPISDAQVVAETKTNIVEEKSSAHIVSKTNSAGKFRLKNMLPERNYELNIMAPGYTSTIGTISSPSKKQTKLIENPIVLVKLPPQNGMFIFSSGQFSQLSPFTKIHRERHILYTRYEVESPSLRYLLESDMSEQSIPKVKNGSYLIIYGKDNGFWFQKANRDKGGYMFPWSIHTLKKFPKRTYERVVFKGSVGSPTPVTIPESYYCGLMSVNTNRERGGHKYEDSVKDVRDMSGTREQFYIVYRLSLSPGKYFLSNFDNKTYLTSTDFSEEKVIGYLFEVI